MADISAHDCSCPKCVNLCRRNPGWMTPAEARAVIAAGRADTVLSVLTLEGDRARKIPVRQWEEVQAIAHLALRGLQAAEVK